MLNRLFNISCALLVAIALWGCIDAMPVGNENVPEPAKKVVVEKYLGTWYELARYDNRFERGCEAVTATYSPLPDGMVKVVNKCRKGAVEGKMKKSNGKAKIVDTATNAKLKVSFFGPFYVGDYWVLDRADDYSWSIVGEPSGKYLWILTREAKPSEKTRRMLWDRAAELGYEVSLLRPTRH
jgi:apolipoprotein D and lipocalin family protein